MIGKLISHYKILDKLGAGGMGEVYKAEDTKLERTVALKFLPPELTRDEGAKKRFIQEARAASALQHNNICTIHEIDETPDGRLFICMDYYLGETLDNRTAQGPMPLREAVATELDAHGKVAAAEVENGKPFRIRRVRIWVPLGVVVFAVAAVLLLTPFFFGGETISAPRPIAVISFENQTGDRQYDYLREVIPNLLITKLEQSKYLSVVSWERMHDLLAQSGRKDQKLIDKQTGFEVCRLDGINTIVVGSFSRAGDVFVTDVKVLDARSKELLKSVTAKGEGVGSVLANRIDELGQEISRGIGLPERAIAERSSRAACFDATFHSC